MRPRGDEQCSLSLERDWNHSKLFFGNLRMMLDNVRMPYAGCTTANPYVVQSESLPGKPLLYVFPYVDLICTRESIRS